MEKRGSFGSKLGAVLTAAGAAVGLGNIWRFPTEVGTHGGAAFILVYLACVVFIGMPVMISEFVIGRSTRKNAIGAFRHLTDNRFWRNIGVEGVTVAFLILCYYVVVSGWTLFYGLNSLAGRLQGAQDYGAFFTDFVASWWMPVVSALLFMLVVHWVVVRGVKDGIERASKVMMPMLLLIIAILVICSFSMSGFSQGFDFLLKPDFSKINVDAVLSAMGQSFYSLSLAMGGLVTYSSYFTRDTNLMKTSFSIAGVDTSVAILSGFVIFPAVFTAGVSPDAGPSLVFITLPNVFHMAFANVPILSYVFSGLFYLLLFLAALTSCISLHEPVTAYLSEEYGLTRRRAAWVVTLVAGLVSVGCALSFGPLKDFLIAGMNLFDLFDFVTAKLILPAGGVLITIFVGRLMDRRLVEAELSNHGKLRVPLLRVWLFLVRWVSPTAIVLVFLNELFG